jgi:hypothetical protein
MSSDAVVEEWDAPWKEALDHLDLVRRGLPGEDVAPWYRLIEWIMKLPAEASRAVWQRLQELKEPKPMTYIAYSERAGHERGLKEGLKATFYDALREVLVAKFPQEGPALEAEFESEQDVERLKAFLRVAALATTPQDFRSRVASL